MPATLRCSAACGAASREGDARPKGRDTGGDCWCVEATAQSTTRAGAAGSPAQLGDAACRLTARAALPHASGDTLRPSRSARCERRLVQAGCAPDGWPVLSAGRLRSARTLPGQPNLDAANNPESAYRAWFRTAKVIEHARGPRKRIPGRRTAPGVRADTERRC